MKELLEKEGYHKVRYIEGKGWVGLRRMAFTVGLFYGLDKTGYVGRYCYSNASDAEEDIENWTGEEDPEGEWIKHKGYGINLSNSKLQVDRKL